MEPDKATKTLRRWLLLGAFSAGLCAGASQRWRTAVGALGLLLSCLGILFSLCCKRSAEAEAERAQPRRDLHETVVAETFETPEPLEAAALVGVLHEYRLVGGPPAPRRSHALELHAALDLVARASGLRRDRLQQLYRARWRDLRDTLAPDLRRRMSAHPLIGGMTLVDESC